AQAVPWCSWCSCSLGLIYPSKPCTMPPITFQDLPLNIYMVIFGTGIFIFVLSLIFCCYFIREGRMCLSLLSLLFLTPKAEAAAAAPRIPQAFLGARFGAGAGGEAAVLCRALFPGPGRAGNSARIREPHSC
uniref:Ring finger protein 122 n=1 Tax=Cyanistes caeruleus TaxID=156563 RepID=A0A8C0UBA4_CYACU